MYQWNQIIFWNEIADYDIMTYKYSLGKLEGILEITKNLRYLLLKNISDLNKLSLQSIYRVYQDLSLPPFV